MKNLALFLSVFGLIAFTCGIYIALSAALGFIVGLYFLVADLTWDMSEFYKKLPWGWNDILETLEVARDTKFFEDGITQDSLVNFYGIIECDKANFVISVDISVMNDFEKKYDAVLFTHYSVSPHIRAMFHFLKSYEQNPERLPDIVNAILVSKKANGTLIRIRQKLTPFLAPAFG